MCDEVLPWLLEARNSGLDSTPVEAPGSHVLRKDQVYTCQPDGLVVNDAGTAVQLIRPVSVRSERRWLAAVRGCRAKLAEKHSICASGASVQIDAGERQVSGSSRVSRSLEWLVSFRRSLSRFWICRCELPNWSRVARTRSWLPMPRDPWQSTPCEHGKR